MSKCLPLSVHAPTYLKFAWIFSKIDLKLILTIRANFYSLDAPDFDGFFICYGWGIPSFTEISSKGLKTDWEDEC